MKLKFSEKENDMRLISIYDFLFFYIEYHPTHKLIIYVKQLLGDIENKSRYDDQRSGPIFRN